LYFETINSPQELVGEDGILRLPSYIFDIFVFDEERTRAVREAQRILTAGGRALIVGPAGTGKTALMAIILRNMFSAGYRIGHILEDATSIGNDHEREGIVLFYDDISKMNKMALRSLWINNVGLMIATLRSEEVKLLEDKLGRPISDVFRIVRIGPMSGDRLREILLRMAEKENITVEEGAIDIVISKAGNLPVYIWQVIRDLRVNNRDILDEDFARRIPQGMLEYIDDILWRVLDDHEEKYEILLTLRILADMPGYQMHQDLMNTVFVVAKKEIYGGEINIMDALFSDVFDNMTRYLLKTQTYFFRLPHDSWIDVLEGKSRGLISGDIARVNSLFPYDARRTILEEAAEICRRDIIEKIADRERRECFYKQLRKIYIGVGEAQINALERIIDVLLGPRGVGRRAEIRATREIEVIDNIINTIRAKKETYSIAELRSKGMVISKMLDKLRTDIDETLTTVSKIDSHVIMYVYNIATSNPAKSVYHLRKMIEYYGLGRVLEFIKILLLNIMPYMISDIVISTYWAYGYLYKLIKDSKELNYALNRMDALGFIQEIKDIMMLEKFPAIGVLRENKEILSEKIESLEGLAKIEFMKAISDPPLIFEEIIDIIKDRCIMGTEEFMALVEENIHEALGYVVSLVKGCTNIIEKYKTSTKHAQKVGIAKEIISTSEKMMDILFSNLNYPQMVSLIKSVHIDIPEVAEILAKPICRRLEELLSGEVNKEQKILPLLTSTKNLLGLIITREILRTYFGSLDFRPEFLETICIYALQYIEHETSKDFVRELLQNIIQKYGGEKPHRLIGTLILAIRYDMLDIFSQKHAQHIIRDILRESLPASRAILFRSMVMGEPKSNPDLLKELTRELISTLEPRDLAYMLRELLLDDRDKTIKFIHKFQDVFSEYIQRTGSLTIFKLLIRPLIGDTFDIILGE